MEGLVFLHIPKCCGSLVIKFLNKYCNGYKHQPSHITYNEMLKFSNTKPYMFVRNPWDWYVSRFNYYNLYKNKKYFNNSFKEHLFELENFNTNNITKKINQDNYEYVWKCKSLTDWIDFISCNNNNIIIFRMEDLVTNLFIISQIENINLTYNEIENFSKIKVNSHNHPNYRTYYDEESKEMVKKYESKIIRKFGYSF